MQKALMIGILSVVVFLVSMPMNESSYLLVLSIVILVSSLLVSFYGTGSAMYFSPSTTYLGLFTLMIYFGGMSLFINNGDGALYGGGFRNYRFYIALNGSLLFLALGQLVAILIKNFSPRAELTKFRQQQWTDTFEPKHIQISIWILFGISVILTLVYVSSRGGVPLLKAITLYGTEEAYDVAKNSRAMFTRYGKGGGNYNYQGYFLQFYVVIIPFISLYFQAKYLYTKEKIYLFIWFGMFLIASFFLIMGLQRWPIMMFLILNYLTYTNFQNKVKSSDVIVFVSISIVLFMLITTVRGLFEYEKMFTFVVRRIFDIQANVLYSLFELIPQEEPFFHGKAIMKDIHGLLPGPGASFSRWLFLRMLGDIGSNAATAFIGELYADFNQAGVFVGSFLAGYIMQGVHIHYVRSKKTLPGMVIYVFITMCIAELALVNIIVVIFQFGIVTSYLIIVYVIGTKDIFRLKPH